MGNATIAKKPPAAAKKSEEIEKEVEPSLIEWKQIWKPLSVIVGGFIIFSGFRWTTAGSPGP